MTYDIEINSAGHYPAADVVRLAELAEQTGFSCIWKGEANATEPFVLLSAAAARTTRLKLGTAIVHIYGRSPVAMGLQCATLQDLSGGRLLLGLGVANKTIAGWHGGTFDRPVERMREYVEIVRRVASGERVEFQGRFYSTGQRLKASWAPRFGPPPIFLAALGPRMTRLAGAVADGVVINMALPEKIREIAARVRESAREAGRDPDGVQIVVKVRVSLGRTLQEARARLRQVLTFYNLADHYSDMLRDMGFADDVDRVHTAFRDGGFRAAEAAVTDDYMDRLPVIPATSIEVVRERLRPFEAAGATRLIIPYVPASEPASADAERFLRAWADSGA